MKTLKRNTQYYAKPQLGDKLISISFICPFKGPSHKMMYNNEHKRAMAQIEATAKELKLEVKLHCIEIDTCKTDKAVPKGYKKYRFDFVGRTVFY